MRVIPVLDVRGGVAVGAIEGRRSQYAPLTTVWHAGSDPLSIARSLVQRGGFREIYVADLDAIEGRAETNGVLLRQLAELTPRVWADVGAQDGTEGARLVEAGVYVVIGGLETLEGPDSLADLVRIAGPERVAFSLDLRRGSPLVRADARWSASTPIDLAAEAVEQGVSRLIVLDLARVGTGAGTIPARLVASLRRRHPGIELVLGGGISGPDELARVSDLGVDGVLVGKAIHEGRIVEPAHNR
jgi:phosphoribosylformimino-5-aminoimidazole carboxamide ribotide isomerase